MKLLRLSLAILILCLFFLPTDAFAQTYYFTLAEETVHVYWNEDGTASIDYLFVFVNDPSASPIDFVDVGLPNSNFNVANITADVDGKPITDISRSGYQGSGVGVAIGLGKHAIQPGETGRVHVFIQGIQRVLYVDSEDSSYASAVFSPTWFGKQFLKGKTYLTVSFHLPPGVQPEEPKWHASPAGWGTEPATSLDEEGRVMYTWRNAYATGYEQYSFGASFPMKYVPESAIVRPSFLEILGIDPEDLIGLGCCVGFFGFIAAIIVLSARSAQQRKLQYLPPKIAIEGLGIKRGLSAIEAAILLEQPLDKILTMILFATIKKNAAVVVKREPLELEIPDPLPPELQPYEVQFLQAFKEPKIAERRKLLQEMMIDLVKNVSNKMKGFSRRETVAYYRDIVKRAWSQVEAAQTPEVKSEKYNEVMEWTMLDKDYEDRTREVFSGGPVFIPTWWHRYDPVYRGSLSRPISTGAGTARPAPSGGGKISLPHLPGSDFAASIANGVQSLAAGVIGNVNEFTSGVTNKTNPVPVSTSTRSGGSYRSGGSGCACACACACAGCACACAGGGR